MQECTEALIAYWIARFCNSKNASSKNSPPVTLLSLCIHRLWIHENLIHGFEHGLGCEKLFSHESHIKLKMPFSHGRDESQDELVTFLLMQKANHRHSIFIGRYYHYLYCMPVLPCLRIGLSPLLPLCSAVLWNLNDVLLEQFTYVTTLPIYNSGQPVSWRVGPAPTC